MASKKDQEAEETLSRLSQGFAKVYNWALEKIKPCKISPADLGIYTWLQRHCDWRTGIYHGTAASIAMGFGRVNLKRSIQRSMEKLRNHELIRYRTRDGSYDEYDILIHGFEPTSGEWKGYTLDAWKETRKIKPFYRPRAEHGMERGVERGMEYDVEEGIGQGIERGVKGLQMSQTISDMADVSDVSDEQSKAEQPGLAQLAPQSGQNGSCKDNNQHHAVPHSDDDEFDPEVSSQLTNTWNSASSIDEQGPRPFDEKDFIRLVNKWHVKIDETKYHLFDMIVFAWRVSPFFTYIKDSSQFEEDFIDVLQKFNGYRSKCSPTKFRKTLMEAWERLTRSETTPDSTMAPAGAVNDGDDEF